MQIHLQGLWILVVCLTFNLKGGDKTFSFFVKSLDILDIINNNWYSISKDKGGMQVANTDINRL